jgi:hypothetical protein
MCASCNKTPGKSMVGKSSIEKFLPNYNKKPAQKSINTAEMKPVKLAGDKSGTFYLPRITV